MHAIAHVSLSYHTISILYSVKEFIDAPSLDEKVNIFKWKKQDSSLKLHLYAYIFTLH